MSPPEGRRSDFPTTRWSLLRGGLAAEPEESRRALEALAQAYDGPIRAYLRTALRRPEEDAADLAQGFFAWVIESGFLAKADPARGRFRSFLKTALRNHVADAARRHRAAKRGGGHAIVPIGGADEAIEPTAPGAAPDDALDDAWRRDVVARALAATEEALRSSGRELVHCVFRDYYLDASESVEYRALAERHGISTVDVSNYLVRAKRIFRSEIRRIVLETVASEAELEEELQWLLGGDGS